ncbi:uncharacterized protein SPAPADRAFT_57709 [Spathaspora passalidarum NRRL Y-27907]|uniref:AB hydrolase-1 domain-containing protein n=1 Tax=Spathaspora passalidarum (strain NRRL Y-27907 / 11-Y1) TaxID=619300 RepID=G3AGY5_SPAPN|nr:uncharacterized protein SPAPADRAFT_57709 [Spathaspora passalidarum NRRL Y-27907]EGW34658.1 hypothetical protein SPAPADRAFT_57709 [Spathaspora passalidarum NRRL Y-27907]
MQIFEFDPKSFSKEKYNVGGISTYVYNSDLLVPYIKQFDDANLPHIEEIPINVLYLVHQRGGDHRFTESIAYNVLKQFYEKRPASDDTTPLICVTFDIRNHGERLVDELRNSGWTKGNQSHAVDMVSGIEGNVRDLKLIIDYLPSYLNLNHFLGAQFRERNPSCEIKFRNLLSGYSLGGHTVFRFASEYPELVKIINPVVGCHDLTSLLVNRLKQTPLDSPSYHKKYFYFHYDELDLNTEQKQLNYPEVFHKRLSYEDTRIFENFPMNKIKMFAAFGKEDTLVPVKLSSVWCDVYVNSNSACEVFVQEGVGHDVTPEMIDRFTTWLVKNI